MADILPKPEPKVPADKQAEFLEVLRKNGLTEQADKLAREWGLTSPRAVVSLLAYEKLKSFITCHPDMLQMKKDVERLAPLDDAVLIHGETGTGKELIANALHGNRTGRFVAINCAGMPKELIESELFGHVKGAFSGAVDDKLGLIDVALNGTLFLDEIGDLPLEVQAKFLRIMQDKKIRSVGGKLERRISVRFIAASHFNLAEQVKEKLFRKDLYARLSTFEIKLLPLRERIADIPLILNALDPDKKFPITKINWKKVNLELNVRSLEQMIRRYIVLGKLPIPDLMTNDVFATMLDRPKNRLECEPSAER